jgi:DNA-directed RNA polymerase specialized sigma24 family protein
VETHFPVRDTDTHTHQPESAAENARFKPTRWSVVLRAREDLPEAKSALDTLCRMYWYPLFAFARHHGHAPHDAQDLTQGFFGYVLEKNLFAAADRETGKLRTFLLTAFTRFLVRERDRARAQKRGGGQLIESLDQEFELGERRYRHEPIDRVTPEEIFARSWADSVLNAAKAECAKQEAAAGRAEMYRVLESFLERNTRCEVKYKDLAVQLGWSEEALRQAVKRLRDRYRKTIRDLIAETLIDPTEQAIDEEMRFLRAALVE